MEFTQRTCFQEGEKGFIGRKGHSQVIAVTEAYFAEFDKPYFLDGLKKFEYRWTKCIELKGNYIEK